MSERYIGTKMDDPDHDVWFLCNDNRYHNKILATLI